MGGRCGRLGALAAVAVLTITLVACGGKSEQAEAQELILGAAQTTFGAGTAQVLLTLGEADGEGQVDFDEAQSEVGIEVDDRPTTVWVDGSEVLVGVDDVVTLVDPDDLDPLGRLRQLLLALSPRALVLLLDGLDGEVEIVGDDTVDGIDVTHYVLHVDFDRLLDQLDGDDRDLMELLLSALGGDGLDVDVWLDDEGRLVQLEADVDTGDDEPLRLTFGLRDFGSDVEIDIPDPTDAVTAEDFARATADIAGHWTGSTRFTNSTDPAVWVPGRTEADFVVRCRGDGTCLDPEAGVAWDDAGAGAYSETTTGVVACTDDTTGEATPGGARFTRTTTWTVTGYDEGGQATEMTVSGQEEGEITAAGQAVNCSFAGGATTGSARIRGAVTRS